MKIYEAIMGGERKGTTGQILTADEKGIEVLCGDGKSVFITKVQFKGSKAMSVRDWLNGHKIDIGEKLI